MNKYYLTIIAIIGTCILSGCAGFQGSNIPRIPSDRITTSKPEKPKIYYRAIFSANMAAGRLSETQQEGEFIRAIRNSECCVVTTDEANSDVQVRVTISKYENPAALIPAFLTGLSLYIIPSWATVRYSFLAAVTDKNKQAFSYEIKDTWTLVQWLPMMFVFPFAQPANAEDNVVKNMHNYLIYKMHQDGII